MIPIYLSKIHHSKGKSDREEKKIVQLVPYVNTIVQKIKFPMKTMKTTLPTITLLKWNTFIFSFVCCTQFLLTPIFVSLFLFI